MKHRRRSFKLKAAQHHEALAAPRGTPPSS